MVDARGLFDDLKAGLFQADEALREIIRTRAWEELGYGSLAEAWSAELGDVRLASIIARNLVAFEIYREGGKPEDVSNAVHGVGPVTAKRLREEFDAGLTEEEATGIPVRRHYRKPAAPASVVRIQLNPEERARYHRLADERGLTLEDAARKALEEWFK